MPRLFRPLLCAVPAVSLALASPVLAGEEWSLPEDRADRARLGDRVRGLEPLPGRTGILSLVVENDLVHERDRHYTSGVRLSWLTGPETTPQWARDAAGWFPLFPTEGLVRTGFALGQSMYTPTDIKAEVPPRGQRPYAGWLYGSLGLISESGQQLDQLKLSIGVVGPASLGEQSQKAVHEITGSPEPQGWDSQLKNEPGLVLTYQRSWRGYVSDELAGFGFDFTPHAGGALGNVFTHASAGLTLRVGRNLYRDYGPPRVQPSLPGSDFFRASETLDWYLFAGIEGRAVARNIFLDGNSFSDSRSVDKKPLVGDLQFGIAMTWGRTRLSYTHVIRTSEFDGQDEPDDFGALSLSIQF